MDGRSTIGGGTTPGLTLPTRLLAVSRRDYSASALEAALRRLDPAIIARIERDRLVLDLRTVFEDEDAALVHGLRTVRKERQRQACDWTSVFCLLLQNMPATDRAARSRTRVGSTPR